MTDILTTLYRACEPLEPATPEFYVDCSDVRGSNAFTKQFCKDLSKATAKMKRLFSGHIGSGKSSELQHLRQTLESPMQDAEHKRFFPIFTDAIEYLNESDVAMTDILLAIVAEIGHAFREELGIELKDTYIKKRWNEVKDFFLSDAETSEGEVALPGLKLKIKQMRTDPELRKKVREQLREQTASLLQEINLVIGEARLQLKNHSTEAGTTPYEDIVLILDNFEKMTQLTGKPEGMDSFKALYIDNAPQFLKLDVHLVLTAPLTLVRSEAQLNSVYGKPPFVLPMIKVETRGTHEKYEKGQQKLREVLTKRTGGAALETIFEPEALEWLLTYCGGDLRELMSYVQSATSEANSLPISMTVMFQGVSQAISNLAASVPAPFWRKMAELELSTNQQIDNNDADYRRMLQQPYIFEYRNGVEKSTPYEAAAPWYAVHPILRELSSFKNAVKQLQEERAREEAAKGPKS